jgi:hypothetical protein
VGALRRHNPPYITMKSTAEKRGVKRELKTANKGQNDYKKWGG